MLYKNVFNYFNVVVVVLVFIPTTLVVIAQAEQEIGNNKSLVNLDNYDLFALTKSSSGSNQSLVLYHSQSSTPSNKIRLLPLPFPTNVTYTCGALAYDDHDSSSGIVYLGGNKQRTIAYLNLKSGESGVLYSEKDSTAKITNLKYFNKTLYWVENNRDLISMNLSPSSMGGHLRPQVIVKSEVDKIQGLAVDRRDGALYYSTWPPTTRTNSSILRYKDNESTTLSHSLLLPRSLYYAHDSTLYFISNPPGIYFTIEKMNLNTGSHQVIMRQAHKHGGSLAVACSNNRVYWSDVVDKRVWEINEDEDKGKSLPGGKSVSELGGGVLSVFGKECEQVNELDFPNPLKTDSSSEEVEQRQQQHDHVALSSNLKLKEQQLQPDSTEELNHEAMIIPSVSTNPDKTTTTQVATAKSSSTTTTTTSDQHEETTPIPGQAIRLCSLEESESIGCSGSSSSSHLVCIYFNTPTCLSPFVSSSSSLSSSSSEEQHELQRNNNNHHFYNAHELQLASSTSNSLGEPNESSSSSTLSWPPYMIALVSVLSTLATVMTLISIYMTLRVRTLSKKPIIRRRVVVSRSTSESNNSPTSVCEMIDIENCCNMNVCETPCYERTLLQPSSSSTSGSNTNTVISVNSSNSNWGPCSGTNNNNKKDDKRCLLK